MAHRQNKALFLLESLRPLAPFLLLGLTMFTVFIIPVLPRQWHGSAYNIGYSTIFFASVIALDSHRKPVLIVALVAFAMEWIASIFGASALLLISRLVNVLFFNYVVIRLIRQIAGYRRVNLVVISEAASGYLLLGLMMSIFVLIALKVEPDAYNFNDAGGYGISDVAYYSFVTLSTLGYGDLLPVLPVAKSIAIFIAVSGQLYLAIVVATLVGKFLNQESAES